MVKKAIESTPESSKKEKIQLKRLKKVTKFKVCITDIFNFKRVVQEETGILATKPENAIEQALVIDPAMEAAIISTDSPEWCYYQPSFAEDNLAQTNYNMNCIDDAFYDVLSMNQPWMFGVEEPSLSFCNYYAQHIEQEVSIYDYGFSG